MLSDPIEVTDNEGNVIARLIPEDLPPRTGGFQKKEKSDPQPKKRKKVKAAEEVEEVIEIE